MTRPIRIASILLAGALAATAAAAGERGVTVGAPVRDPGVGQSGQARAAGDGGSKVTGQAPAGTEAAAAGTPARPEPAADTYRPPADAAGARK